MKKITFENEEVIIEIDTIKHVAFVKFKGFNREDLSNGYIADAEIHVQEFLDGRGIEAEAQAGIIYSDHKEFGITVPLNYK